MALTERASITPYRDGPYLLRGDFVLRDQDGNEIDLRRRTIALCRCGKSRTRPFCDGTHKLVGFEAPSAPADQTATASKTSTSSVEGGSPASG
jgi:CDGSH-type Zn-finger protein